MQPFLNDLRGVIDRLLQGALPDDSHTPSKIVKHCSMAGIPRDISSELLLPEFAVRLWRSGVPTAFVSVPETAVNEYDGPVFREHQIGRTRKISYVKPVSKSLGEQNGAKHPLRPSVLPANARHHAAALRSAREAHGLACGLPRFLRRKSQAYSGNFTAVKISSGCGSQKPAVNPIRDKSRRGN